MFMRLVKCSSYTRLTFHSTLAIITLVPLSSERRDSRVRDLWALLICRRGIWLCCWRAAEGAPSLGHLLCPDGRLCCGTPHPAPPPVLSSPRPVPRDHWWVLAGPPPHQVTEAGLGWHDGGHRQSQFYWGWERGGVGASLTNRTVLWTHHGGNKLTSLTSEHLS